MGFIPPDLAKPTMLGAHGESLAAARGLLCAMALSAGFWLAVALAVQGLQG